jgi:hypothetical protein
MSGYALYIRCALSIDNSVIYIHLLHLESLVSYIYLVLFLNFAERMIWFIMHCSTSNPVTRVCE